MTEADVVWHRRIRSSTRRRRLSTRRSHGLPTTVLAGFVGGSWCPESKLWVNHLICKKCHSEDNCVKWRHSVYRSFKWQQSKDNQSRDSYDVTLKRIVPSDVILTTIPSSDVILWAIASNDVILCMNSFKWRHSWYHFFKWCHSGDACDRWRIFKKKTSFQRKLL